MSRPTTTTKNNSHNTNNNSYNKYHNDSSTAASTTSSSWWWWWRLVVFGLAYPLVCLHLFCSQHLNFYDARHANANTNANDNHIRGYCVRRSDAWEGEAGFLWTGFAVPLLFLVLVSLLDRPSLCLRLSRQNQKQLQQLLLQRPQLQVLPQWLHIKLSRMRSICRGCCGCVRRIMLLLCSKETVCSYALLWIPLLWMLWDTAGPPLAPEFESNSEFHPLFGYLLQASKPTGYASIWALSLFLLPVTKHDRLLDALQISPVSALHFHKAAGWTSLWLALLHGVLEVLLQLREMELDTTMDTTNITDKLRMLLWPTADCWSNERPWALWSSNNDNMTTTTACTMALYNISGTVSVGAFVMLALTSLPWMRRRWYAWFYAAHVPLAWIMMLTALVHNESIALFLLPNLVYYVVWTVPVHVQRWLLWDNGSNETTNNNNHNNTTPWSAISVDGGRFVELTFQMDDDQAVEDLYESPFVRLHCPEISRLSHPFSIILRRQQQQQPSFSILFRAVGPFTKALARRVIAAVDDNDHQSLPPLWVDGFYPASHQWVHRSIYQHDKVLLVAGGVGIVPFLNFVPHLWRAYATAASSATATSSLQRVVLHWYCREQALAQHVLEHHYNHQHGQLPDGLEFEFHLHITSLPDETTDEENLRVLFRSLGQSTPPTSPLPLTVVPSARLLGAHRWLATAVLGTTLVFGFCLGQVWYQHTLEMIGNITLRSYSILAVVIVALLVAVTMEMWIMRSQASYQGRQIVLPMPEGDYENPHEQKDDPMAHPILHAGRPAVSDVVAMSLTGAVAPGVFQCGPTALMRSVQSEVLSQPALAGTCCFYKESSEL